jgi:hypothetical protein
MKQDLTVLQRLLEQKEHKMSELMKNTVQAPALKQHYDRVLQVGGRRRAEEEGGGEERREAMRGWSSQR